MVRSVSSNDAFLLTPFEVPHSLYSRVSQNNAERGNRMAEGGKGPKRISVCEMVSGEICLENSSGLWLMTVSVTCTFGTASICLRAAGSERTWI